MFSKWSEAGFEIVLDSLKVMRSRHLAQRTIDSPPPRLLPSHLFSQH
jgi:hypothetical protein